MRVTILDWILGRNNEQSRQEAAAKAGLARQAQQEPVQEHAQIPPSMPPKRPEAVSEPEKRPAVRMMPQESDRMHEARERQPEPEQKPELSQEATRMANTMTPQRGPSMGGSGMNFVNPLAQRPKPSAADEMLAEARARLAREEAAKTPEQKLNDELQRLERPDYSRERFRWDNDRGR